MLTRAKSASGLLSRSGEDCGKSPFSDQFNVDNTVVDFSSPPFNSISHNHALVINDPINKVHQSTTDSKCSKPESASDLDLMERRLALEARELELKQMRRDLEGLPVPEATRGHSVKSEGRQLDAELTAREMDLLRRELSLQQREMNSLRVELEKVTNQGSSHVDMDKLPSGVTLPRIEIPSFDGSPLDYWKFRRAFDVNIANRVRDDAMRFNYLQYYCKGKAREVISGCSIMDSNEAYSEAWKILEHQFGKPYRLVQAMLREVLDGPPVREDLDSMQLLARKMKECLLALTQMDRVRDLDVEANLLKLVNRLPERTKDKWATKVGKIIEEGREPTFADLLRIVEKRISALDNVYGMSISSANKTPQSRQTYGHQQPARVAAVMTPILPACAWCGGKTHGLGGCKAFSEVSVQERRDFIRKDKRCFVCLGAKHFAPDCQSSVRCKVDRCGGRHHTLLHASAATSTVVSKTNAGVKASHVRLGFVPVVIRSYGRDIITNALVDNGSDVTLISKHLAERLKLVGDNQILNIRTLHGTVATPSKRVSLSLQSADGQFTTIANNVFTIDHLPCEKVDRPLDVSEWSHLQDVNLPPMSHDKVELLIGCDVPEAHWVLDQRLGKSDEPFAVLTPFGWTVRGDIGGSGTKNARVNLISVDQMTTEESLESLYEREFSWSQDEEEDAPSKEDKRALAIVEESTKLIDGRFEVGVPWKRESPELPNNRCMARYRAELLRKRLSKDKVLLSAYLNAMESYIGKGYIEKVSSPVDGRRWYLPHHPVLHPKKPGKVRVVFDCAAKHQGTSLNDELLSGPNLNNDLAGVLVRFREGLVATSADIEEMFLRVRLPVKDRWAFSFLWWSNDELLGEPNTFQWNVHPFGAKSSPFCAAYALRRVSLVCSPETSGPWTKIIEDNFYVDDCLMVSTSITQASSNSANLKAILQAGGFKLTKWVSSHSECLNNIEEADRVPDMGFKDLGGDKAFNTLGLLWDIVQDALSVDFTLVQKPTTRRGILSVIASFFDPLGIIGPFLLPAKVFLQRLCRQGLGWDSKLDVKDREWWYAWVQRMGAMPAIRLPRCVLQRSMEGLSCGLHVFCDASETGYGAVAYCRVGALEGNGSCYFLIGKTRVVPNKPITIPRLELTAAVLGVKLLRYIQSESRLTYSHYNLWTDSQLVLQYISNTTCRFKTYVANRITYILERSTVERWKHVPTKHNPADVASRGLGKYNQEQIDLWLQGPAFLAQAQSEWPSSLVVRTDLEDDSEVKRVNAAISTARKPNILCRLLTRYSTWWKLVRGVAWLRRFVRYVAIMKLGSPDHALSLGPLDISELENSEKKIVSLIQEDCFQKELSFMKSAPERKLKSSLARLKPVVRGGLMCLGGRLPKALVILPQQHPAIDRLISSYHEACGHMGATHVLANLRKKYWIVKGMSSVRRVLNKCMICKAASARSCEQVMAPLPVFRIERGCSPFLECGVDYFGPFEIKKGRTIYKRYGCLFTCLKTRAVHIEIAHALSTDSFLMALIRFVGRRGTPNNIYSDNGSNFVGAEAELGRQVLKLNQTRISSGLTVKGIAWHFNPPHASHRGGVWERMIRTTRRVLSAVVKNQTLTEESLTTFMVETERIINDRPIAPLYDDPMAPVALRPNDLLLMRPNEGLPSVEVNLLERYTKAWRQAQHLSNMFWKRWQREYIPTLQLMSKWNKDRKDLKVGDLVLLIGGVPTYGSWPKGIITDVHRGLDGHVRDVEIRTATGLITRDIRSVCLLEAAFDVSD